ncbi:TIGR02302 family protein [Falsigemmobacter intermedius]|uniref:TIGR02302 family protein n=1 Tax=Falsigemmobacter intermedius TaxID=1553448 RepID=UPI003F0134CA
MTKNQSADLLNSPRLRRILALTRIGLWVERGARAFWPVAALALAGPGLAALGLLRGLPPAALWTLIGLWAVLVLSFFVLGLRRFQRPTAAEALTRVDARLPGRPLAALGDAQAVGAGDPASAALWAAHQARMAAATAGAKPVAPSPDLAPRDPYALRLTALLLAAVGALFGSLSSVTDLRPAGGTAPQPASGPVWEGWIRPPAYTGRPVIYLNALEDEGFEAPQGSEALLRFYGEAGALGLEETVSGTETPSGPEGAEFTIRQHGSLTITGEGGKTWEIGVLPDLPPQVTQPAVPERQADGTFKLPFEASDDYGITAGQLTITLDLAAVDRSYALAADPEPREALVLDLPLPFRGRRSEVKGVLTDDLAAHPFANLPVILTLQVTDAAGQTGESAPLHSLLPGRRFFDPLAAVVAEVRRDLLWNRSTAARGAQILRAVTWAPENFIRNDRAFLRIRTAIRQMEAGALSDEARDALSEELFSIAALLEEGDLNSALERLRRAQDRLDEAMKNGASPSEIRELMDELREAMDDYMEQLAKEQERPPSEQSADTESLEMSGNQLQQMLDKLEQLMAEGKMAEAQELMEMLRQLMANMQVTQGEGGQGRGQGQGQGRMRDLADSLREQQNLSDEAFRNLQRRFDGGGQGEAPGAGQSQSGEPGEGTEPPSLADRQRDLRNRLRALGQTEMPGDGGPEADEGRRALDRSREAMEGAEEALRNDNLPGALDRQAEAMEALREGMRRFEEAEARERGETRQGEAGAEGPDGQRPGEGRGRGGQARDPLGRQAGSSGGIGSEEALGEGMDANRRAMDLLEELRRRSGEQHRPEEERDYLRRLLEQF